MDCQHHSSTHKSPEWWKRKSPGHPQRLILSRLTLHLPEGQSLDLQRQDRAGYSQQRTLEGLCSALSSRSAQNREEKAAIVVMPATKGSLPSSRCMPSPTVHMWKDTESRNSGTRQSSLGDKRPEGLSSSNHSFGAGGHGSRVEQLVWRLN